MLSLGVHQGVDDHDGDDGDGHHDEVLPSKDGLSDRHGLGQCAFGDGLEVGSLGGHRQWDGARQAGVPYHETTVRRSDEQAVIDAAQLLGNLLGEDDAHDEAETPVEPAGEGGDACHQGDGAGRGLGKRGEGADASFDGGCCGEGGSGNQHQGHLHGKSQQRPHAVAPVLHHL